MIEFSTKNNGILFLKLLNYCYFIKAECCFHSFVSKKSLQIEFENNFIFREAFLFKIGECYTSFLHSYFFKLIFFFLKIAPIILRYLLRCLITMARIIRPTTITPPSPSATAAAPPAAAASTTNHLRLVRATVRHVSRERGRVCECVREREREREKGLT